MESSHREAEKDVTKYMSNPLNAFVIIKQLTSVFHDVQGVLTTNANGIVRL